MALPCALPLKQCSTRLDLLSDAQVAHLVTHIFLGAYESGVHVCGKFDVYSLPSAAHTLL